MSQKPENLCSQVPSPTVNFSYVAGESGDISERVAFWDAPSTVQWFRDHGYILYQRGPPQIADEPSELTFPSNSSTEASAADYPYAHYDLTDTLWARESEAKVVFAQNSLNHHVAIKLVKADTDELKILQFLKTLDLNVLRDNCVIPVLDILSIEGFSFVVMPRWGIYPLHPWPQTLRDLLMLMHSQLRALNFLHKHNIAHRDINEGNFLVNHCVHDDDALQSTVRKELRSQNHLLYAIFDFDHSVKLPPGVDRSQFRLPYKKSWGSINVISDTAQGEYDFNPFIFDVGALGVLFCYKYQNPGIAVNFSLVAGESGDIAERIAFWDAPLTVQWFRDHGYILYQRGPPEIGDEPSQLTFPSHSSTEASAADYPYAYYDLTHNLGARDSEAKVVFAQNSLNHHVAIKLVKADTDELKILQFLKTVDLNVLKDNCVIPILDILPIEGFSFVVMPRWGIYPFRPWPRTLRELLGLIHSKLRALNFLHEHNIAHRDINEGNFLVNHCLHDDYVLHPTIRRELRSQDRLLYAIFDFDQSIKLPHGVDRSQFRLPYYKSWGTYNVVSDTAQGEYDFNPFIFDVGALGVIFCRRFQLNSNKK
ncbi:hypothetical protein JR316_0006820 [Psilocybe cubensis]|uniref:Uncharacterized protein n=2 Tax=Psilocybe cubensis TaxID=181762 RepID=A0ACB8GXW5_PSICU|nr:hypothetical protein JR316_0006820 [Psilocybe cubensis]KAH9480222.1 hypothetical protein JR316_0006820 [Psilocybe cubensis]